MSWQDLPPEVIAAILATAQDDKMLLAQISLTCRDLRAHAEPLLYTNIVIPRKHLKSVYFLAKTVLQNDRLAKYVKSYTGPHLHPPEMFGHLEGWVGKLVNLKKMSALWHDGGGTLPKCLPRLESLELEGIYNFSDLEHFLMDQKELIELKFTDHILRGIYPLSPLACPNLKVLSGNIKDLAGNIFPGRNIRRFDWRYPVDEPKRLPNGFLHQLSPQLAKLRSLSYGPRTVPERIHALYDLPDFLPSLLFLEVQLIRPEDWLSIPKLAQLRVLLVLEPSYISKSLLNQPGRIMDLFGKCSKLERIDVGGRDHLITLTCQRWLRGAVESLTIPLRVAEHGSTEFINDGLYA